MSLDGAIPFDDLPPSPATDAARERTRRMREEALDTGQGEILEAQEGWDGEARYRARWKPAVTFSQQFWRG